MNRISRIIRVRDHAVSLNGNNAFRYAAHSVSDFMEQAYRSLDIRYPRFHKMDRLCQLGFLSAELLLKEERLRDRFDADRLAIVLSNRNSSLDTDIRYYRQLQKGIASPALFVYSLPNIVIGEISIRHGFKGEHAFFVTDEYDIPAQVSYVNDLLNSGVADACLCGWVELLDEQYESFLYLAAKSDDHHLAPHTIENIKKHYTP